MLQDQKHYVCVTSNGSLIGVDIQSGGYPFIAVSLHWVEFWLDPVKAQEYADLWKNSSMVEFQGMTVKEFHWQLTPI
jgi:hypothetical protein